MHASDLILYKRSGNYIPRVAAVHDLCGYGKCSLAVAMPTLSAAGCDVCPVPTSIFSSHTLFPHFASHDTTEFLPEFLDAWEKVGIDIDAIYSGFLGSAKQVDIIKRLYKTYPQALKFVDPVMGDDGKAYPTYTDEMCQATAELATHADVLTPNLTEASIITGIGYEGQSPSKEYVEKLLDALLEMGAKYVILKGIERDDQNVYNYIAGHDIETATCNNPLVPYKLHGTGDLYASSVLAAIMSGKDLQTSVDFAGNFVHDALIITKDQPDFEMRGVQFEPCLARVSNLLSDK